MNNSETTADSRGKPPPSSAAKVLLWGNVRFIAGAHFSGTTVPLVTSDRSERSWWLSWWLIMVNNG
jgi:hypothetical protein